MEELFHSLEKKIKALIEQHDQLKQHNQELHLGKSTLSVEKEALLTRQQKAISQIETLVSKLRSMEETS